MLSVSVIVPCYNEEATIGILLAAIREQTYPLADLEVVIADGGSTDGTRAAIDAFRAAHPDLTLRLVENPRRIIPAALNRAIAAARGEILVRLDAHCRPYPDYIARCVADLEAGLGDNVGGVWEIQPGAPGCLAAGIAAAAAHPLGAGDALYRRGVTQARAVDTVPFGAFRRELVQRLGDFDESLASNEDYEFNARLRQAGGRVWLDPDIRSVYFARPTLRGLAAQYGRYGFWKWRMLLRHPRTVRLRQALPPAFVAGLLLLPLLAFWWRPALWLWLAGVAVYLLILLAAGVRLALRERRACLALALPAALAVMHLWWGGGFLWSVIMSFFRRGSHG